MLVAHVHDGSRFASVRLLAEDALKILLNFSRDSTNRTLLTWTVLVSKYLLKIIEITLIAEATFVSQTLT